MNRQVTLPDKRVIEYLVDGQGRRVGKKINGKLEKTWIYQSQLQIAAETNGDGTITKRFVYGEKANVPDYVIDKTGTFRIVSDHLGSPRALVNTSNGKMTARFYYDEFGNKLINCDENTLPFGFAGGLQDKQTGLILFGAREYDPSVGRWLSKDPLLFNGGQTNLYGYVMNDSVNRTDPNGKGPLAAAACFALASAQSVYYSLLNSDNNADLTSLLDQQASLENQLASANSNSCQNPNTIHSIQAQLNSVAGKIAGAESTAQLLAEQLNGVDQQLVACRILSFLPGP